MTQRLVLASANPSKVAELQDLLDASGLDVEVLARPDGLVVIEDAPDFVGNARLKADAVAAATGEWALSDDSGLVVDALSVTTTNANVTLDNVGNDVNSLTASTGTGNLTFTDSDDLVLGAISAGDVIVEVAQEAVTNAADVKKRIEQLKKDGKKSVLLLVSNGEGELRFVALPVK